MSQTPEPKNAGSARLVRIVLIFRAYRARFLLALALAFTSTMAGILIPIGTGRIVDLLISHDLVALTRLCVVLVAVTVGSALLNMYQARILINVLETAALDLRLSMASKLQRAPIDTLSAMGAGELANRIDGDVEAVMGTVAALIPSVIAVVGVIVMAVIMPFIDLRLALLVLMLLPAWYVSSIAAGERVKNIRTEMSVAKDKSDTLITEHLDFAGVLRVKSFNRYEYVLSLLGQRLGTYRAFRLEATRITRWIGFGQQALAAVGPVLVLIFGAYLVLRGLSTIGTVVAFLGLTQRLQAPIGTLAGIYTQYMTALAVLERVFRVLDLPDELQGSAAAQGHAIHFDRVSFSFGANRVLDEVSFEIAEGARVAITGPSGVGKTTIAMLATALHRPLSGSVTLGGTAYADLDVEGIRANVKFVGQDPNLVTGTILENLLYGDPGASPARLREACDIAGFTEVLGASPEGWDRHIGSRGARLSGGQRQRLALARALLSEFSVLILDEATSALDHELETTVMRNISDRYPNATLIVVTHRPQALPPLDLHIQVEKQGIKVDSVRGNIWRDALR